MFWWKNSFFCTSTAMVPFHVQLTHLPVVPRESADWSSPAAACWSCFDSLCAVCESYLYQTDRHQRDRPQRQQVCQGYLRGHTQMLPLQIFGLNSLVLRPRLTAERQCAQSLIDPPFPVLFAVHWALGYTEAGQQCQVHQLSVFDFVHFLLHLQTVESVSASSCWSEGERAAEWEGGLWWSTTSWELCDSFHQLSTNKSEKHWPDRTKKDPN